MKIILNKPSTCSTKALYRDFEILDVRNKDCEEIIKFCILQQLFKFNNIATKIKQKIYIVVSSRRNKAIGETCHEFLGP